MLGASPQSPLPPPPPHTLSPTGILTPASISPESLFPARGRWRGRSGGGMLGWEQQGLRDSSLRASKRPADPSEGQEPSPRFPVLCLPPLPPLPPSAGPEGPAVLQRLRSVRAAPRKELKMLLARSLPRARRARRTRSQEKTA